jgi:hypothetical protein
MAMACPRFLPAGHDGLLGPAPTTDVRANAASAERFWHRSRGWPRIITVLPVKSMAIDCVSSGFRGCIDLHPCRVMW